MLRKDGTELQIPEDSNSELSRYVDFTVPDGRTYGFPLAHLVNYILEANPDADTGKDTPPDRLTFYFSSHDVSLLGWRLKRLVDKLKMEMLSTVRATKARYAEIAAVEPVVCEIKVKTIAGK